MALELVHALLCLASECTCMLTGWDESSGPCAQEYRRSSHPNRRKAEILVQPNKNIFAAYKSIFCDTLSSRSVLSWKWQVNVCFALTLKVSLLWVVWTPTWLNFLPFQVYCVLNSNNNNRHTNKTKETKKPTHIHKKNCSFLLKCVRWNHAFPRRVVSTSLWGCAETPGLVGLNVL